MKERKNLRTHRYQWAIIFIICAVIIITILDAFCVLASICPELLNEWFGVELSTENISREDAFLSSGLSIIGLAISVWATLNIINVLDKKDVYEVSKQLNILKSEYDELSIHKEVYQSEISKIHEQNKNLFLCELEKLASDKAIAYFASVFSNKQNVPYAQLSIAMQYHSRVYQLHTQRNNNELLKSVSSKGIEYINKLLDNEGRSGLINSILFMDKETEGFLHFCKAELLFYRAYYQNCKENHKDSLDAVDEYKSAFKLLDISIPNYINLKFMFQKVSFIENLDFAKSESCSELEAYWCNTLGECYSKAVQNIYRDEKHLDKEQSEIDNLCKKAIFYCTYAVKCPPKCPETYLRNLGCAIEAAFKNEPLPEPISKKIKGLYNQAMMLSISDKNINYKVLYVWLSFNHKLANDFLDLYYDKDPICKSEEFKTTIDELVFSSKKAIEYAELAIQKYPDNPVFYKFNAFVYRDLCVWEYLESNKTDLAFHYYEQLKSSFDKIERVFPDENDDFINELKDWCNKLENRLGLSCEAI